MAQFRAFKMILATAVVSLTIWGGASVHARLADDRVQEAVREAKIASIKHELDLLHVTRMNDLESGRSDVDQVIRGIVRMKMADRLRDQARGLDDVLFYRLKADIIVEIMYQRPYLYQSRNREIFLAFGDALHYVGLTPEQVGLTPDYWVALANAK